MIRPQRSATQITSAQRARPRSVPTVLSTIFMQKLNHKRFEALLLNLNGVVPRVVWGHIQKHGQHGRLNCRGDAYSDDATTYQALCSLTEPLTMLSKSTISSCAKAACAVSRSFHRPGVSATLNHVTVCVCAHRPKSVNYPDSPPIPISQSKVNTTRCPRPAGLHAIDRARALNLSATPSAVLER